MIGFSKAARLSATICAILAACNGTAAAQITTKGDKSWSYSAYQEKLAPIKKIYDPYPIGLNIRKEFWGLQLDRAKMTFRTYKARVQGSRDIRGTVTYGKAVNIDGDSDFEVMQCGWKFQVPSSGHFVAVDFKDGKPVGVKKFPIEGCSDIWPLKRRGNKIPLIVVMGLDEGKLPDDARAPLLIYDPKAKKLIDTHIRTASHESVVIDFDNDGNEDIVACNWRNGPTPADDGSILFLRNTGTGLEVKHMSPPTQCMAVEVMKLTGGPRKSILVADVPPAPATDPALKIKPERNQVFNLDADLKLSFAAQLPLPYFERSTFDGIPDPPGWSGNIGRSHDVQIARGDIDGDGFEDAVMSSMLVNDQRPMGAFQIMRNKDGRLVDETDKRLFNELYTRSATHNFTLEDVNGDGFLDIVGQTAGFELEGRAEVDTALTHGNTIYINDGTGHFANVLGYQLGEPYFFSPWTFHLVKGRPHWTRIRQLYQEPTKLEIDVAEYADKLSTGPALSDPAKRGVPGFNELYYLLKYPDAAASVRAGKDASGLDHYLRVGRAEKRETASPAAR